MNTSSVSNFTAHASLEEEIQQRVLYFLPLLFVWGALGVLSILSNVIFLLLSKFTTGGSSPVLVFMRSICLADVMTGLYAVFKAVVFNSMQSTKVNCFLPDSILITATTASVCTLVWLHVDCCLRFTHPLKYIVHIKKENIITGMVLMWNISFVLGFLPLMGWNNEDAICAYHRFYSSRYVYFIASLWCTGLISSVVMEVVLKRYMLKVNKNQHLLTVNSREFERYQNLISTNRIELIGWFSCIVLLGIFATLSAVLFRKFRHFDVLEVHILYIMPIFLVRACTISVVRSYKTTQIHLVTKKLRRQVTKIINKHSPASKVNSVTDTIRSNIDSNKSTEANNSLKASFRKDDRNGDIKTIVKDAENPQQSSSQGSDVSRPSVQVICADSVTAVENPVFNMDDEMTDITSLPVSCKNGLLILESELDQYDEVTYL